MNDRSNSNCAHYKKTKNYLKNIRQYNNAFAMASLMVDDPIYSQGSGQKVIKLHGQCYTAISDPDTNSSSSPKYSQLYFMDPEQANDLRANRSANSDIDRHIIDEMLNWLQRRNPFVQSYLTMYEMYNNEVIRAREDADAVKRVSMGFVKGVDERRYNKPTSSDIAVIYFSDEPPRDIYFAVHSPRMRRRNSGIIKRLLYYDPQLDPLAYPMLFPLGKFGWEVGIKCIGPRKNKVRKTVTIREMYSFRFYRRDTFLFFTKAVY